MNTETKVETMRQDMERAADSAEDIAAAGLGIVDIQELEEAALRAVPLLRMILRAKLVVAEAASRIEADYPLEARVLREAAGGLNEFTSACEEGKIAAFLVDQVPPPALDAPAATAAAKSAA